MTTPTYASGQDFITRYDARLIGDLVRDDETEEPADSVPVNTNLLAALGDAYGDIVATIVVGGRYTLDQIDPAAIAPSGVAYLTRLQCDLALLYLKRRRGLISKNDDALQKSCDAKLKALKDGAAVLLGITDAMAAASVLDMTSMLLIPINQRNTIRWNTREYYPSYPDQTQRVN